MLAPIDRPKKYKVVVKRASCLLRRGSEEPAIGGSPVSTASEPLEGPKSLRSPPDQGEEKPRSMVDLCKGRSQPITL